MVVRHFAPTLLKRLEDDPDELARLETVPYSRAVFGISFAFLHRAGGLPASLHNRYWVDEHLVRRVRYRVTSQWFAPHRARFLRYLGEGREVVRPRFGAPLLSGLAEGQPAHAAGFAEEQRPFGGGATRPGGRLGHANHIGNAQNLFARNVLSRLAPEAISDEDWPGILAEFGGRCAYCGAEDPTARDHVVPINRQSLGEHRRGNLVPSCAPCNSLKGGRDVEVFLADSPDRLAAIHAHRRRHGYRPIGDNPAARAALERAAAELAALADRTAAELRAAVLDARNDGPR